jgi:hypothetical protein
MQRLRSKLTYANVISTLCLFLLLGGGAAYAANALPKNSVGAKQLKKGAITPAKLTPATIKALTGPAGPQGAPGIPGAPGATNVVVRLGKPELGVAFVKCQPNEVAVGGGGYSLPNDSYIWGSRPYTAANDNPEGITNEGEKPIGWRVGGEDPEGHEVEVRAYAVCASP